MCADFEQQLPTTAAQIHKAGCIFPPQQLDESPDAKTWRCHFPPVIGSPRIRRTVIIEVDDGRLVDGRAWKSLFIPGRLGSRPQLTQGARFTNVSQNDTVTM